MWRATGETGLLMVAAGALARVKDAPPQAERAHDRLFRRGIDSELPNLKRRLSASCNCFC